MFDLKRTKDYVSRIKEKYPDISEEDINYILLTGLKNLCHAMYRNMDIRFSSWGIFYKAKHNEIKRLKDREDEAISNQDG